MTMEIFLYTRGGEYYLKVEGWLWVALVTLEDVVTGDGIAEYGSEEDVGLEVGSQADARKANRSR